MTTLNNSGNGYTEGLDVTALTTPGFATVSGVPVGTLPAGSGSTITATVSGWGPQSGNLILSNTSDGAGTSGLGKTGTTNLSIAITGTGYYLANPVLSTTISAGAYHVGQSATGSVTLTNATAQPTYAEQLDVTLKNLGRIGERSAEFLGGAIGIGDQRDGERVGSADGQCDPERDLRRGRTSGLGLSGLSDQSFSVSGTGYYLANPVLSTPINAGAYHVGQSATAR